MTSARERLRAAQVDLEAGFAGPAVSAAYYAALYAARAALSEEDRNAKTHRGAWSLFGEVFVLTRRFDSALAAAARNIQELREAADYDARAVSGDEAGRIVEVAEQFVDAVAAMLDNRA
jgi:uncharacterized protein (UPF0332 family)